jgi:prophage regulatory protein
MLDLYSMSADPNPTEIVRITDVLELTGLRRTMLYDLIGKGRFPAQVNLGARAVGWYKREVLEWICSRSAAKHVSGSTESEQRRPSAGPGTASEISKMATRETEVQKKHGARNKAPQRLRKEVGDIRVHDLPTTSSCGSEVAMSETEELKLLRDENARLKQLVGELFLKNSTLLEAVAHRCLRHHQECIGNAKAPITKGEPE